MEWATQAGGGADVVVWGGQRAYVRTGAGQGLRLRVLDTSDVNSPTWSGELKSTELRSEYGTVYRDGRLYMLGSWCRVTAVGVANPDQPELLGAISLPCDNGNLYYITTQFEPEPSFDVEGDIAYVLENAEGLQVVDMADPESPEVLGQYEMPGVYQRVVRVAEGYAYSEASDSVLYVTDVSDPADAVLCAEIELPIVGPVKEMVVEQERVHILDADETLHVVDVSAPCAPLHETSLSLGGSKPSSLAVEGAVVLITDGHAGLYVVDLADAADPVIVGPFASPHECWPGYRGAPAISEDHVLARFGGNLAILDVSQSLSPEVAATVWMGYEYHDMLVRSGLAFAATSTPGLEILDISQPGVPVSLGFHITQKPGVGVALAETTALLAWSGGTTSDDSGLDLVDVTWPTKPTLLGSVVLSGVLWDIEMVGPVAYIASALSVADGAVWVVDVVEPAAPQVVGEVVTESPAKSIISAPPYLYVGTIHGLDVLESPEEGTLPTLGTSVALVDIDQAPLTWYDVSKQELILSEELLLQLFRGHVHVYDISIPVSPVHLGAWTEFGFDSMGAAGEYVVGQKNQTKVIRLLDISDPEEPAEMAQVDSTLFADAFYAESGYLFVGGIRAMDVYDVRGCW